MYRLPWIFALGLAIGISAPLFAQVANAPNDAPPAATSDDNGKHNDTAADDKQGDQPGAEITSEAAAAAALKKTAEETKQKAGEAAEALQQGDVVTAASKGWEAASIYIIPAATALIVMIIAYFIAAFLARLCSQPVRRRVDETLGRFVGKLVFYLIMVCALLGVLQYFGIGIASFAAVLAAAGFAIGLAFQGTLSNFAAGVMLLVFRPFKVGDVINAAGITAKVDEIDLFTTVFSTPDNRKIIVPNSAIASGTIENITFHKERRVDVNVGVAYDASLDQTREVLAAAAEALRDQLLEGEGRGYQIALLDLGDSAVNWTVRFWTTADHYWPVKEQLTYQIKTKLDEAHIGIPFPQMDIHMIKEK
jgi:small conductance mechanosensitive channel